MTEKKGIPQWNPNCRIDVRKTCLSSSAPRESFESETWTTFFGGSERKRERNALAELFDEVRRGITLSCGVRPYLRVRKQLPLRVEQEGDPVRSPRHGDSPDGEGRQHRVGEERGKVDHAPG